MAADGSWHLAWWYVDPAGDKGYGLHVDALVEEELSGRVQQAVGELQEITRQRQLMKLRRAYNRLEKVHLDARSSGAGHDDFEEAIDAWLTTLRGFADRTAHQLSRRFGDDSAELAAFKAECSREYDENFAYRFTCRLRSYVQHVGGAIQHFNRRFDADGHPETIAAFDPRVLLDSYKKWGPQVRADLDKFVGYHINAMFVIGSAMTSCELITCRTVLNLRLRLEAAAAVVAEFVDAHYPDAAVQPLLAHLPDGEPDAVRPFKVTMIEVPRDPWTVVDQSLQSAKAFVDEAAARGRDPDDPTLWSDDEVFLA